MKNDTPVILIAEDSVENINIICDTLSDYKCQIAKDGQRALIIAHSAHKPDLILLDVMMPIMDGFELIEKLKSHESTKDIPVIFLTAKTQIDDEIKGLELGAVDYINKPINPLVVKARVRTHLELTKARQKLKEQNKELILAAKLTKDMENITRHDLKGPLTVILATPDLLMLTENLTKTGIQSLERMKNSGLRMLRIINNSIDLFKMERGLYKVNAKPINILDVIYNVKSDFNSLLQLSNLKINIINNSDEKKFILFGEELLFYTLFSNLIKNAIEASPADKNITVTLRSDSMKIIQIHNFGSVSEEIREKFFEKYITHGKHGGTGLGTYSAKLITECLHGNISMQYSETKGTTIKLVFPNTETIDKNGTRIFSKTFN